jgi:hypothetical protein
VPYREIEMALHGAISLSIPVVVTALDDHDAVTVAAPSAVPTPVMIAAKFGTSATVFTIAPEFSTVADHLAIATDPDANILSICDAGRGDGKRNDGGQRVSELSHLSLPNLFSMIRQRDKTAVVPRRFRAHHGALPPELAPFGLRLPWNKNNARELVLVAAMRG